MDQKLNPEMVVLARESRGLSQEELAARVGVSQSLISLLETGNKSVSLEVLRKLASALRYPVRFFFFSDSVYGPGTDCVYHRKRITVAVSDYRKLLARVNVTRIQISRLLHGIEIDSENSFLRLDVEDYSPAVAARAVRAAWRLPQGPIKSLTTVVESAGGIIVSTPFNARKLDAISQWPPGLPPVFLVNSDSPPDRARFTLAHEIGHLVMHVLPSRNQEDEADQFASEFLMPAKDISPHLRPLSLPRLAELKNYWGASMAAILRRAHDLKKISTSQYRRLFTQLSALGYRIQEPSQPPVEKPTLLDSIVNIQLTSHGHSLDSLSSHAGLLPSEFVERYRSNTPNQLRLVT